MGSQRVSHILATNIVLHRIFFFNKLKACGNLAWGKSISAIFPTVFAHFLCLCHILVIMQYFKLPLFCYMIYFSYKT